MSSLFVYHTACPEMPQKVLNHYSDIAATLAEKGVTFAHLQVAARVKPGAEVQSVMAALEGEIELLKAAGNESSPQVISLDREHPQAAELRAQWLQEQFHEADEVRLLASGRALFSLHLGDYVYALICERGDVLSIPAGTRQWADLGEQPHLVAIRMFSAPDKGAHVTGDDIVARFGGLDD